MAKYKICFASVSSDSNTVPFSGLTMREIYNRFVISGQRPVENTQTVNSSEDDPYDPSQDYLSRVKEMSSRVVVNDTEVVDTPVQEVSE